MTTSKLGAGLLLVVPMTIVALCTSSCSDDKGPTGPADTTAPNAVVNLAINDITASSVQLTWTATGDDGANGTARHYDIRYSTSVITASNFDVATSVVDVPTPTISGTNQHVTVSGLAAGTMYHFAMKPGDEVTNWAALSNQPVATTANAADTVPPVAITDLGASPIDASRVLLTWTAPGDDGSIGSAHQYDIRYATSAITAASWASATQVTGEPDPIAAGSAQDMMVSGLLSHTNYFFAMKSADEALNLSSVSNGASALTP